MRDLADGRCRRCEESALHAVGESLRNGENAWFLEGWCRNCEDGEVEFGRGFVPEAVRGRFLELTGRWRFRVDQGPDAGVAVLRVLRRVYDISIREARERRAELLGRGLSGTRGEVTWLAAELADLGVPGRVAQDSAGTQTELPERRMPMAPSKIGGGAPESVVAVADAAERERIAHYLATALCLVAGGYWIDPVTRHPGDRGGDGFMTDGTYLWSVAWATLVRRHGLPLAEDFVAHVRTLGYQPPALSAAEIRAVQVATGFEPPEEA